MLALQRLPQIPVEHTFCSDSDEDCQKLLQKFYNPKTLYGDVSNRKEEDEKTVDLYIATPPCQAWSAQGKKRGLKDPRGGLMTVAMKYVKRRKPRAFVLENVKGLCAKRFKPVLKGIKENSKSWVTKPSLVCSTPKITRLLRTASVSSSSQSERIRTDDHLNGQSRRAQGR